MRARELIALESLGAEVLVMAADVADTAEMQAVVDQARARFGAVNGIFHAAGAIDDTPMAMKTLEEAHRVLSAKAQGARVLDRLAPDGTLDMFAVFSSTSVLITPPGQSDYVAGNAIAETVAASRSDGRVITWGIWADIGMAKRAADAGAVGNAGAMHPLLGVRQETRDGTVQFAETYSEATLWTLSEHRIGDITVLPGAAYVEISSAAALSVGLGDQVDISQLSYVAPLAIRPRQSRQVRTTLTPLEGDGFRIEVESRAHAGEGWLLHFDAQLSKRTSAPDPVSAVACETEIDAERLTLTERGVGFGPRWSNVSRARVGDGAVSADFVLPRDFVDDLETYRIHPALFDTSFAAGLFLLENDAERGVFAPVSIGSVRVYRTLTERFSAEGRLTAEGDDTATFDVDIKDASGTLLLEVRGACFRRVEFGGDIPAIPEPSASARDRLLAEGIRAAEAHAMFEQLFTQGARSFVVSPVSVAQAKLVIRGPAAAASSASSDRKAVTGGDPVEQRLAEMCAEILGVDTLGLDEEFLSYGGGSLTGVRLFARIRRDMGVELALSALLQAPTIRLLAVLVREKLPEPLEGAPAAEDVPVTEKETAAPDAAPKAAVAAAPPAKPAAAKARWSPLVRMAPGASGGKPVFLIHGAGGTVLVFKPLADRLRSEAPVYGIEAQGIDGTQPVLETIEEMADLYVRHILTLDPKGPYRLVGYSGGGVIAVEMAHQLRRSGREVEFLCLLDTLAPQEAERPVRFDKEVARFGQKLQEWVQLGPAEIGARIRKRANSVKDALRARVEPKPEVAPKSHIEILSDLVEEGYMKAQRNYHPPQYDGDVLLFRAEHALLPFLRAGEKLGWDDILIGKMDIIFLDADHFSLIRTPTTEKIADEILSRLNALKAKAESRLETV